MGAFEMLLNLPESQQRKVFKDLIENATTGSKEKRYAYHYEIRNNKRKDRRSIKGIWADKFYTLRNHIIHGQKILPRQFVFKKSQRHTDIALLFFVFLIKMQINKSLKKRIFVQRIDWGKVEDTTTGNKGYNFNYMIVPKLRWIKTGPRKWKVGEI
ncbi:hypothetical protein ACFLTP_03215 [Chloroflexota bacterium]